jgi:hypothetical protein
MLQITTLDNPAPLMGVWRQKYYGTLLVHNLYNPQCCHAACLPPHI